MDLNLFSLFPSNPHIVSRWSSLSFYTSCAFDYSLPIHNVFIKNIQILTKRFDSYSLLKIMQYIKVKWIIMNIYLILCTNIFNIILF